MNPECPYAAWGTHPCRLPRAHGSPHRIDMEDAEARRLVRFDATRMALAIRSIDTGPDGDYAWTFSGSIEETAVALINAYLDVPA